MQSEQKVHIDGENIWEMVPKHQLGPQYDAIWHSDPCIAITKNSLVFNRKFMETFGLTAKNHVYVLFNEEKKQIGVQICQNDDERLKGFVVSGNGSSSKTLQVHCTRAALKFPKAVKRAFKAKTVPNSRVIFIEVAN